MASCCTPHASRPLDLYGIVHTLQYLEHSPTIPVLHIMVIVDIIFITVIVIIVRTSSSERDQYCFQHLVSREGLEEPHGLPAKGNICGTGPENTCMAYMIRSSPPRMMTRQALERSASNNHPHLPPPSPPERSSLSSFAIMPHSSSTSSSLMHVVELINS